MFMYEVKHTRLRRVPIGQGSGMEARARDTARTQRHWVQPPRAPLQNQVSVHILAGAALRVPSRHLPVDKHLDAAMAPPVSECFEDVPGQVGSLRACSMPPPYPATCSGGDTRQPSAPGRDARPGGAQPQTRHQERPTRRVPWPGDAELWGRWLLVAKG